MDVWLFLHSLVAFETVVSINANLALVCFSVDVLFTDPSVRFAIVPLLNPTTNGMGGEAYAKAAITGIICPHRRGRRSCILRIIFTLAGI
jgi:hypothetical protein